MADRLPLRVVDEATGELVVPGCKSCQELAARVSGLEGDLDVTQDKLTQTLRQVAALKRDRDAERLRHRRRKEVEQIFADWQEQCGKSRSKLTPERFDVIAARLADGYTPEHLHLAAYGAMHANPWRVKPGQEPMREVATYASRGTWLEQFARAGALAKRSA